RLGSPTYKLPGLDKHPDSAAQAQASVNQAEASWKSLKSSRNGYPYGLPSTPATATPPLRSQHPRLVATSEAHDPDGFPMSLRLETFQPKGKVSGDAGTGTETRREAGVRLNITARMMAVQAPWNWGKEDSERFFTRHFYRALLQRVFLEKGVIRAPQDVDATITTTTTTTTTVNDENVNTAHGVVGEADRDVESGTGLPSSEATTATTSITSPTPASKTGPGPTSPPLAATGPADGTPIILGTLPKSAYTSFPHYLRAAVSKLANDKLWGPTIHSRNLLSLTDAEIANFEHRFEARKKDLAVVWSLMAFSAGVVESLIVVDRYLWLREQEAVGKEGAWVECVFGPEQSPRNFVVVGVKKQKQK
ncbi:hypothetical protein LTS18_011147, partial [Coniosporium uncinatum]